MKSIKEYINEKLDVKDDCYLPLIKDDKRCKFWWALSGGNIHIYTIDGDLVCLVYTKENGCKMWTVDDLFKQEHLLVIADMCKNPKPYKQQYSDAWDKRGFRVGLFRD